MTIATAFTARLDAVEERLAAHAAREFSTEARTSADPGTGETWEAGQVWAHIAEFVPYWLREVGNIVDHDGDDPVPFGRTKTDPQRLAAIERDRATDRSALWARVSTNDRTVRALVLGLPDDSAWARRGLHPTLGEMNLAAIVDEFLVGHLEQHADQLDSLVA